MSRFDRSRPAIPRARRLVSTATAANALGTSARTVRDWCRAGLLPGVLVMGHWRVPIGELERVLEEGLDADRDECQEDDEHNDEGDELEGDDEDQEAA